MVSLHELAIIVNKTKLRALRDVEFPFSDHSELGRLYLLLSEGNYTSDEALAEAFGGLQASSRKYQKLKTALSERLLDSLFLIDLKQPAYNDRQRAYYECYKEWSAAKILQGKNARRSSIALSEKVLKHTLHYEFSELSLDISRHLRLHYGTIQVDTAKYNLYAAQAVELSEVVAADEKAEVLYTALIHEFVSRESPQQHIAQKAALYFEELRPLMQQYNSYNLHLYGRLVQMMQFTASGDNESALPVCEEMIGFFSAKPYTAAVPLLAAYYQKMVSLLELRRYSEPDMGIQACLALLEEGSYNWFKYQETYLILLLHTRRYTEALDIFNTAVTHRRFPYLPASLKEYWRILEAYLHFLAETGQFPSSITEEHFSRFRLSRFLNETPIFSRDKRGLNISILIVQILFLVAQKKYAQTVDKIDAIQRYLDRYLNQPETRRAYYFLKALLVLPKNRFNRIAVNRKAERFIRLLQNQSFKGAQGQAHLIEILPFEHQWELILNGLDTRT